MEMTLSNRGKVEYADSILVFIAPADGYATSCLKIDGESNSIGDKI